MNHKMILTLIQSFARFFTSEIRKVASQMREEYQNDIMGKVAITIYSIIKALQLLTSYVRKLKSTSMGY